MEIFSALLALSEGNPPVTGGFPLQRPVTRTVDAGDLRRHRTHYDVIVMEWREDCDNVCEVVANYCLKRGVMRQRSVEVTTN